MNMLHGTYSLTAKMKSHRLPENRANKGLTGISIWVGNPDVIPCTRNILIYTATYSVTFSAPAQFK